MKACQASNRLLYSFLTVFLDLLGAFPLTECFPGSQGCARMLGGVPGCPHTWPGSAFCILWGAFPARVLRVLLYYAAGLGCSHGLGSACWLPSTQGEEMAGDFLQEASILAVYTSSSPTVSSTQDSLASWKPFQPGKTAYSLGHMGPLDLSAAGPLPLSLLF